MNRHAYIQQNTTEKIAEGFITANNFKNKHMHDDMCMYSEGLMVNQF